MGTTCTKITLSMEDDDGQKWESVIDTALGVRDVSMSHEFLPDTAEEKITLTIIRRSKQSEEYAVYRRGMF